MSAAREAMTALAYAHGAPVAEAVFKRAPEDFRVSETLGFDLSGDGEHFCLHLRKRGLSTSQVASHLAAVAGIREHDVGFAGMKDKQGVTEQWFSLYLPGKPDPALDAVVALEGVEVLDSGRNHRKIRRGSHRANHFKIVLRELKMASREALLDRLAVIGREGVPHYFGEQRFGVANQNVALAEAMFTTGRKPRQGFMRGLLLSAARSHLFNAVLAARVDMGIWAQYLAGDVMGLDGSEGVFEVQEWDETLAGRLQSADIHPTGPLWGKGALRTRREAAELEERICKAFPVLCAGLEAAGLVQARRSLRLPVKGLDWQWEDHNTATVEFILPPGAYATSVLREVVSVKEAISE